LKRKPQNEDTCPIQDGDPIPMWMTHIVYKRYAQRYGTQQTLERIIERGGFGIGEVIVLFTELGLDTFDAAKTMIHEFYPDW